MYIYICTLLAVLLLHVCLVHVCTRVHVHVHVHVHFMFQDLKPHDENSDAVGMATNEVSKPSRMSPEAPGHTHPPHTLTPSPTPPKPPSERTAKVQPTELKLSNIQDKNEVYTCVHNQDTSAWPD